MTRVIARVGGQEIISSGTIIAKGDLIIELYPFDDDVDYSFKIRFILQENLQNTGMWEVKKYIEPFVIEITRPWLYGKKIFSANIPVAKKGDVIYYGSFTSELDGTPNDYYINLSYSISRNS